MRGLVHYWRGGGGRGPWLRKEGVMVEYCIGCSNKRGRWPDAGS